MVEKDLITKLDSDPFERRQHRLLKGEARVTIGRAHFCEAVEVLHRIDDLSALDTLKAGYEARLAAIKNLVCGERIPNWKDDWATGQTRGRIADMCEGLEALAAHDAEIKRQCLEHIKAVIISAGCTTALEEIERMTKEKQV